MKLPSLKISLPFIFLCWCIAGVQSHGLVILAYPAMWAVVGLFFFVLHLMTRTPASNPQLSDSTAYAGSGAAGAAGSELPKNSKFAPTADDSATDHQVSNPV